MQRGPFIRVDEAKMTHLFCIFFLIFVLISLSEFHLFIVPFRHVLISQQVVTDHGVICIHSVYLISFLSEI